MSETLNRVEERLKRIISAVIYHNKDWNPQLDSLSAAVVIEAENALRELRAKKRE